MFGAALTVGASRKEAFSGGSKKRGAYRNNKTRRKHITCGELEHRNSIDATDFRESNMPFYRKQFNYLRSGVLNNHTPFYLNS